MRLCSRFRFGLVAFTLIIWLPLVAVLAVALMRPGKGLMTALQMLRQRSDDSPRETR